MLEPYPGCPVWVGVQLTLGILGSDSSIRSRRRSGQPRHLPGIHSPRPFSITNTRLCWDRGRSEPDPCLDFSFKHHLLPQ